MSTPQIPSLFIKTDCLVPDFKQLVLRVGAADESPKEDETKVRLFYDVVSDVHQIGEHTRGVVRPMLIASGFNDLQQYLDALQLPITADAQGYHTVPVNYFHPLFLMNFVVGAKQVGLKVDARSLAEQTTLTMEYVSEAIPGTNIRPLYVNLQIPNEYLQAIVDQNSHALTPIVLPTTDDQTA